MLEQSCLEGSEMSLPVDQNGSSARPLRPRLSMVSVRVVVLAVVLAAATIVYTSFRPHLFSSSTARGAQNDHRTMEPGELYLYRKDRIRLEYGRAFFIFGDSYADVGNIPGGPASVYPYGTSWPGHPTGRFSDGSIQPDYLATQIPGCQSPPAFAQSNVKTLSQGANFAVGGAGLTYAYGLPTVSTQVSWFEAIVQSGVYSEEFLASSVTLVCAAGNDYATYEGRLENYEAFAAEIVGLIKESLQKLYRLGLRNIMVATLAPLNCLPISTVLTNFTTCASNETVEDVQVVHNGFLEAALATLSKDLSGVNFVLLRQGAAMKEIQKNKSLYNFSEPLKPCCLGYCGGVDRTGNLLYTLCELPENYVFWDEVHPTQAAWENIVKLYVDDEAYTTFAPTLRRWAQNLP